MPENITNMPKTATFQMRINPDIKKQAESIFADCGLTLTDAVNIFIQQSINTKGLPFLVAKEAPEYLKAQALARFLTEVEKGWQSVKKEDDWLDEADMYRHLGLDK